MTLLPAEAVEFQVVGCTGDQCIEEEGHTEVRFERAGPVATAQVFMYADIASGSSAAARCSGSSDAKTSVVVGAAIDDAKLIGR